MAAIPDTSQTSGDAVLTPKQGLLMLGGVIVAVAGLVAIGMILKLTALYGGFLFVLYWTGLGRAAPDQFWPALLGAQGGIALAWSFTGLPALLGPVPGMAVALALVLLAVYLLLLHRARWVVNHAMMLFLTVGAIPALMDGATLSQMSRAVVVTAAYVGALVLAGRRLAGRRA
ncbi:hypothetical protein H7F50_00360 [Novosphingobium flavum]|uniref:Uncharacterized protein n=1 Tax=Novosphingobium aerophilum TaxID=2839843 RepID=A0A7X1F4L4_9SPHN|nr:hypothetical protein [Novosphingobium aerophilum]MBC2650228.1 hypothetical protein [Novosphingobium aerophilum]MBC2660189.1 hypothetical protein [Novosphingobium aerophilum]